MRWTTICLLLGVFIVFDTPEWIVEGTGYPRNWLFHGLLGLWIAFLSGALINFFLTQQRSFWRSLAIAALCISIVESMEMPVCLLAVDPTNVNSMPRGISLCDYVVGFPIGKAIEIIYLLAILFIVWRARAKRSA